MNRTLYWAALTSLAVLCALAPTAQAVVTLTAEVTTSPGSTLTSLSPGDEVTVDVTMRSDVEPMLHALGLSATGYDDEVVSFSGGAVTDRVFLDECIPVVGCFGGIPNLETNASLEQDDSNPLGPFVPFLTAVTINPYSEGPGELDFGAVTGVQGDAQFRLIFTATNPGATSIFFGADPDYGGYLFPLGDYPGLDVLNGVRVNLFVVPEPTTAVLFGFGLAVLSARRRKRR